MTFRVSLDQLKDLFGASGYNARRKLRTAFLLPDRVLPTPIFILHKGIILYALYDLALLPALLASLLRLVATHRLTADCPSQSAKVPEAETRTPFVKSYALLVFSIAYWRQTRETAATGISW
eukprot:2555043-Pleurochrysis_carterae.AAC.4